MKNFSQRGLLQLGMVTPRRKMSGQVNTHLALSPLASAGGWGGASREETEAHAGGYTPVRLPVRLFFQVKQENATKVTLSN